MIRSRNGGFAVLVGAAVLVCAGVSVMATPEASACSQIDPNCVSVGTESPGSPGSAGDNGSSDGGSASSGDTGPACWWTDEQGQPDESGDPRLEGNEPGSGVVQIYVCATPDGGSPAWSGNRRFIPNGSTPPADPSPGELAEQAAASFRLPDPTWGHFPAFTLKDGRPYTVVKTHMWFWTDPATWQTLSATAQAGANWATVTATPEALVLVPGDGNGAVECASSGRAFDKTQDAYRSSWVPQPEPDGCDYVYQRSTWDYPGEVLTASLQIRWVLSWTGSGDTSGTLTSRVTSADSTFMVAELQAVVTG